MSPSWPGLADAAQRHAEMLGLDHDQDTEGLETIAQTVGHLSGESLLHLCHHRRNVVALMGIDSKRRFYARC